MWGEKQIGEQNSVGKQRSIMKKLNLHCTMEGSAKSHIIRMKKVVFASARVCVEASDCTQNNHVFFSIKKVNGDFLKAACRKRLAF